MLDSVGYELELDPTLERRAPSGGRESCDQALGEERRRAGLALARALDRCARVGGQSGPDALAIIAERLRVEQLRHRCRILDEELARREWDLVGDSGP